MHRESHICIHIYICLDSGNLHSDRCRAADLIAVMVQSTLKLICGCCWRCRKHTRPGNRAALGLGRPGCRLVFCIYLVYLVNLGYMLDFPWIYLNMFGHIWIYLDIVLVYVLIHFLHFLVYLRYMGSLFLRGGVWVPSGRHGAIGRQVCVVVWSSV